MNFFKDIRKNVIVLGVASLFTDISSEMLYPIIPIFLTSTLGVPMSIVGLIEGIAESTASILKAVSGWWSDKVRRRMPFVIGGYTLSSLSKPILYLSYVWPTVLVARFLDRFGKGLRVSARDAMIADSSEKAYRGKAFGFHRTMDSLGACIGPILAIIFLTGSRENIRIIFLIAFIPAILAVLTLALFLKEVPRKDVASKYESLRISKFGPNFYKFLAASAVFAIGNSSDAFLILRSKQLGLSLILVIVAYILYNLSYTFLSTPFGALSDKMSRKKVMVIGYGIFALVYLGFSLITSSKMVWALFPIYGFYMAMTDGIGKALVSDMVASEYRATALGLYHFILGIFAFAASLIAGLLWTHVGAPAPFIYGTATAVISCILLSI